MKPKVVLPTLNSTKTINLFVNGIILQLIRQHAQTVQITFHVNLVSVPVFASGKNI